MDQWSISEKRTLADPGGSGRASLPPGHTLGQYRLVRLLGRGGMGEVYEAEHTTLGLHYALKLLPLDFASRPGALERFRREARVMAQLQHSHIVKVDDFGDTEGRYWLRMELMTGVGEGVISLADLAKPGGGKVGQKELLSILKQVVEGLGYAHSRGAVHRDLKPGNILLEKDSAGGIRAKVADFGLVRLVGEEWIRSQAQISVQRSLSMGEQATEAAVEGTSTKALLGTYEYMSPEQKRGEEADARSDIYSIGLLTFKLLTGKNPGLKSPSQVDRGLAEGWDNLLYQALEDDRNDRLSSSGKLMDLLLAIEAEINSKDSNLEGVEVEEKVEMPKVRDHQAKYPPEHYVPSPRDLESGEKRNFRKGLFRWLAPSSSGNGGDGKQVNVVRVNNSKANELYSYQFLRRYRISRNDEIYVPGEWLSQQEADHDSYQGGPIRFSKAASQAERVIRKIDSGIVSSQYPVKPSRAIRAGNPVFKWGTGRGEPSIPRESWLRVFSEFYRFHFVALCIIRHNRSRDMYSAMVFFKENSVE